MQFSDHSLKILQPVADMLDNTAECTIWTQQMLILTEPAALSPRCSTFHVAARVICEGKEGLPPSSGHGGLKTLWPPWPWQGCKSIPHLAQPHTPIIKQWLLKFLTLWLIAVTELPRNFSLNRVSGNFKSKLTIYVFWLCDIFRTLPRRFSEEWGIEKKTFKLGNKAVSDWHYQNFPNCKVPKFSFA